MQTPHDRTPPDCLSETLVGTYGSRSAGRGLEGLTLPALRHVHPPQETSRRQRPRRFVPAGNREKRVGGAQHSSSVLGLWRPSQHDNQQGRRKHSPKLPSPQAATDLDLGGPAPQGAPALWDHAPASLAVSGWPLCRLQQSFRHLAAAGGRGVSSCTEVVITLQGAPSWTTPRRPAAPRQAAPAGRPASTRSAGWRRAAACTPRSSAAAPWGTPLAPCAAERAQAVGWASRQQAAQQQLTAQGSLSVKRAGRAPWLDLLSARMHAPVLAVAIRTALLGRSGRRAHRSSRSVPRRGTSPDASSHSSTPNDLRAQQSGWARCWLLSRAQAAPPAAVPAVATERCQFKARAPAACCCRLCDRQLT